MKEINQFIMDDVPRINDNNIISANATISISKGYISRLEVSVLDNDGFLDKYEDCKGKILELLEKMKETFEIQLNRVSEPKQDNTKDEEPKQPVEEPKEEPKEENPKEEPKEENPKEEPKQPVEEPTK